MITALKEQMYYKVGTIHTKKKEIHEEFIWGV